MERYLGIDPHRVREKRYLPDDAWCPLVRTPRERAWPTLTRKLIGLRQWAKSNDSNADEF